MISAKYKMKNPYTSVIPNGDSISLDSNTFETGVENDINKLRTKLGFPTH